MNGPAIVQSDRSVLLEVAHPDFAPARERLAAFAELEKSPEHIHTYRISPVSLWNAAAAGIAADQVAECLTELSRYEVPQAVLADVHDLCARYGRLQLRAAPELDPEAGSAEDNQQAATTGAAALVLTTDQESLLTEVLRAEAVADLVGERTSPTSCLVPAVARGLLKQTLIGLGWPVDDQAPYEDGAELAVELDPELRLRAYQREAADAFTEVGAGTVVLPCGAGKTIVGLAAIAEHSAETLIVTSNTASVEQWRRELAAGTTLAPEAIGEYTGKRKQIRPVTVTTYQMLTHRPKRDGGFPHLEIFDRREWGLVIYDEVHLLPAPVFRATASIQARRRLGLTATLIREDGAEPLVFSLVGPKRYDTAWRELEDAGWIAAAECIEVRVPLGPEQRLLYAGSEARDRFRIASTSTRKEPVAEDILRRHPGAPTLVIGYYVDQLRALGERLGAPVITGKTSHQEREQLYAEFRAGELPVLCVSKVANFALDLPAAVVAIQVSGTFGSRQEEAQRLGRLLRPKPGENRAWFYTLVSHETSEQDFAHRRQLFLAEQGYSYTVLDPAELGLMPQRAAA